MKGLLIICFIVPAIFWSCSEDKLDTYDGTNSVYFAVQDPSKMTTAMAYLDSTYFSFVNYSVPDTVIRLKVNLLGDVVSYDRTFGVEVVGEATTAKAGEHYETLASEYTIPADSVAGIIPLKLLRSPELRDSTYVIHIRLVPTTDLKLALEKKVVDKLNGEYIDLLQHTVYVSDLVAEPLMWRGYTMPGQVPEMGSVWSVDKYLLTNYLLEIVPTDWDDRSKMGPGRRVAISIYMRNYLTDMIAKGTAVRDDKETDGFMKVKGVVVPAGYSGTFVSASELMK